MHNRPRQTVLVATAVLACLAGPAAAHKERPIESQPREGSVPDLTRKHRHTLVVCKASSRPSRDALVEIRGRLRSGSAAERQQAKTALATWKQNTKLFRRCRYEHIQAAVNDATDGTGIKVLPGVYREEPSRAQPSGGVPDLADGSYSYEYHVAHPNDANLIAILGKKGLTLEGTGSDPRDVIVDAGFVKDVPIRADRADGIIIRNLWARDGNEHCIYVVETAGYAFDRTVGSFCRDYELFSFASDLGLYTDCEAEGGGDSGVYTGGNPDTSALARFSVEIRRCKMHTNALGFSSTQGSSVWMHDNDVYDNAVGLSFNTQNDHPNPPERQSLIENNLIHDNNLDIYAADTPTPAGGPAYGFLRYPVGTAMWIVGGDDNVIRNNFIYGNQRFGVMLFGNPLEGPILAEVNRNQVYGNVIGVAPDGTPRPNGRPSRRGRRGSSKGRAISSGAAAATTIAGARKMGAPARSRTARARSPRSNPARSRTPAPPARSRASRWRTSCCPASSSPIPRIRGASSPRTTSIPARGDSRTSRRTAIATSSSAATASSTSARSAMWATAAARRPAKPANRSGAAPASSPATSIATSTRRTARRARAAPSPTVRCTCVGSAARRAAIARRSRSPSWTSPAARSTRRPMGST